MYSKADLAELVPYPSEDAHKYSRGKMVLVAGSATYPGAACLSAHASQKIGAGYTEVFTDACNKEILLVYRPSLVVRSFDEFDPHHVLSNHYPGACVIGPGFDVDDAKAIQLCQVALAGIKAPLLIDGGALSLITSDAMRSLLLQRQDQGFATVLTPHDGEAARLLSASGAEANDRMTLARILSQFYHAFVVLKGHTTIVSDGFRAEELSPGSPALAKAGTGDVLAGMTGGLLAQGVKPFDACVLGVTLHGMAGICASRETSVISVCAEDVIEAIPQAIEQLTRDHTE